MSADLDKHTVRLEGRARLRMTPGKTMQNAQADLKPASAPPAPIKAADAALLHKYRPKPLHGPGGIG
jgi:hypothetical protein